MTASKAARKWGVTNDRILKWIKQGKVTAKWVQYSEKQWRWEIPDDHPCPVTKTCGTPSETRQRIELYRLGKRLFIARYAGTLSIDCMARLMETTCAEVRAIYGDVLAKGGF